MQTETIPEIPRPEAGTLTALETRSQSLTQSFEALPVIETDDAYAVVQRVSEDASAICAEIDRITEPTVKAAYAAHKAAKAMQNGLKEMPMRVYEKCRDMMRVYLNEKARREAEERERAARLLREAQERAAAEAAAKAREEARQRYEEERAAAEAARIAQEQAAAGAEAQTPTTALESLRDALRTARVNHQVWQSDETALAIVDIERQIAELEHQCEAPAAPEVPFLDIDTFADLEGAKAEAAVMAAPLPAVAVNTSLNIPGARFRVDYRWRVVEESIIPREYMEINTRLVDAEVKARKLTTRIPGIEVYEERVPVKGRS